MQYIYVMFYCVFQVSQTDGLYNRQINEEMYNKYAELFARMVSLEIHFELFATMVSDNIIQTRYVGGHVMSSYIVGHVML